MLYYILMVLYVIACFVLILFVLLQPGKSDAAAVFGGGANSSAFGPRGTQTILAKITIGAAIVFFLIAFLFAIPGWLGEKSVAEDIPAESAPAATQPPATTPAPAASDQAVPSASPSPAGSPPAGAAQSVTPAAKPDQKGGEKKQEQKKP